jgi:hypothetical protein
VAVLHVQVLTQHTKFQLELKQLLFQDLTVFCTVHPQLEKCM